MGITEAEARNLTHGLLGTKQISVNVSLFTDHKYIFDSIYRQVRHRAGRSGRAATKDIPDKFANLMWSVDLDADLALFASVGEGFVQEKLKLDWTPGRNGRRRRRAEFMNGVYATSDDSRACYEVDTEIYTARESIYVKEHDMDVAEGSICMKITMSVVTNYCSRVFSLRIASTYKLGAGSCAEPLTPDNDELLSIILPSKAKERLLVRINEDIKFITLRDKNKK